MAKNLKISSRKYLILLGDILILYFSLWLTLLIRYRSDYSGGLWSQHLIPFTIIFLVWLIIFYIDDLYELGYQQGRLTLLSKVIRSTIINGVIAVIFFYFTTDRLFTIKPQRILLIDLIVSIIFLYGWRIIFYRYLSSQKIANGLLVIGFNQQVKEISEKIKANPQLGFQLKAIIVNHEAEDVPAELQPLIIPYGFKNLKNTCLDKRINVIVSTIHPRQNPDLLENLFDCLPLNINFFDIAAFYEKITGKVPVTTIEQIWFLENLGQSKSDFYERLKFIFDMIFSSVLLVISLPFLPFIALAVRFSSFGPIFFIQERVGKDGLTFNVIKFRTMVTGAEKNGPQWATDNDPRVTALGKFLRKTRIDEIPQLINILRGEMSLIGPRPERPEFVSQLSAQIPFYKERLLVKPGLTGWAQVVGPAYGGSKEESLEKLQYDLYYIKNQSVWLDLSIVLKTIKTILTRKGQ